MNNCKMDGEYSSYDFQIIINLRQWNSRCINEIKPFLSMKTVVDQDLEESMQIVEGLIE